MKIKYVLFTFIIIGLIVRAYHYRQELFSDWDEGIYAEVADEVIDRKTLVFSYFNGEPWLDKPPVTSILTAGAFVAFPQHKELASRMVMVVVSSFLLIILYLLSKKTTQFFFSQQLSALPEWQREIIFFTPVFATALTPVFLDRAIRLNTDSILALSWIGYLLWHNSFVCKIAFIALGTWTKSLAGLYPMLIEPFLILKQTNKFRYILQQGVIVLIGVSWLIINYFEYGQYFIKAHIQDQLIKRINVPIELHFGGRLYYPEFLWQEMSFVIALIILGFCIILWDIYKRVKTQKTAFITSNEFIHYVILMAGIPFFIMLTVAKSKLWWYLILIVPLLSLVLPYFLLRIERKEVRNIVLIILFAFFVYKFVPATYALKVDVGKPDKLRVAQCVAQLPVNKVDFMVNEQERKNRNVVEAAQLQTNSSFLFGGAPSFVHYVNKKTVFHYKDADLINALSLKESRAIIISREDYAREEFTIVRKSLDTTTKETRCYFGEWMVFSVR